MALCTSGRSYPVIGGEDKPCGKLLVEIGRTSQKNLPVLVCRRCDNLPKN